MNIYKFTKNTVELSQYYKNIDSIRSIIIIGNTCGLCGWFKLVENDKWDNLVPEPDMDNCSDAAWINVKCVFQTLINNKADIVVVCDSEDTKAYWETVYHYFCVRQDVDEICNFTMIDSIKENKDYETVMKDIKTEAEKRKHKFDVGFINAPYDGTLHEKFESMMFDLCNDEIVWVGPTTWLLGKKQKAILTESVDKYHAEIQSINGVDYFDGSKFGQMGITYINKNADDKNTIFDGNTYSKCSEISTYSNDHLIMQFKSIVEPLYVSDNFVEHIKYMETSGHELRKKEKTELNPDNNWWIFRVGGFAGSGTELNYSDDFYTVVSKNDDNCIGRFENISTIYNGKKRYLNYYFVFNSHNNTINFYNYCKSFFARLCLYLTKNSVNLVITGEMRTIPWFDFSDPMFAGSPEDIDVALFRKYGISQQIVDHILEILPNYYNLDLTKYKNI